MQRRPRGEMDITPDFGSGGPGSIPGEGTYEQCKGVPSAVLGHELGTRKFSRENYV